jgi:lipoprotein-releasing system permease protein
MRRQLHILEYALSALWRRRYKSLALVAIYSLTVAILASILFLTQSLKTEATRLLASAPELIVQKVAAGRHDLLPLAYLDCIREIPGVAAVSPRVWGYYYDSLSRSNYTLMGIGPGDPSLELLSGRLPTGPVECAIGAGVAAARGTGLGRDLILVDSRNVGRAFEVVGVFRSESRLLTNDLVVLDAGDLRNFFGLPADRATDAVIEVPNPSETATVAAKIKARLPDTRPITRGELLRTYDAVFDWRGGILLAVFAPALIAFGILAWDKATGISAEEKREVGILKAVGWDTADVLVLKFWEGIVISLTAFLLGLLAAFVHVFFFGATLLAPVLRGWSVLFPKFHPVPYLDFYQLAVVGFLTVAPYVACTVVPAWKTAITDPDSVMRT